jgi:membrane protease YdiL (CAAX protease family)
MPLLWSTLLVLTSIFALNTFVSWFPLENILENEFDGLSRNFIGAFTIAVLAPVLEEVMFRGAIQGYMMRRFNNPWVTILAAALVFGVFHLNPVQVVYATLLGVILGWIYYRTGSLLPVILGHVLNNSIATISMLLGLEEGGDMPLETTDKVLMAVVFVVATAVAVKLVQVLDRELPAVAKNEGE